MPPSLLSGIYSYVWSDPSQAPHACGWLHGHVCATMVRAGPLLLPPHRPPAWSKESCPKAVVYLYSSDPLASISSHYRRGHAHHQALKTASSPAHVGPAASFPPTLQDYCAQGQDLFGYEGHFRNWLAGADNYPILMLRCNGMLFCSSQLLIAWLNAVRPLPAMPILQRHGCSQGGLGLALQNLP